MTTRTPGARQLGFTLIELLLLIIVTAVLGAVFVSAYETQSVRAEVAAGIKLATRWQPVVERAFHRAGQVPADWTDAVAVLHPGGNAKDGVPSIELVNGRLEVTFGSTSSRAIASRQVSLTPYETATQKIVWICGNAVPGPGLQPLGFAAGGAQSIQAVATIEARYLPINCR